MVPSQGAVRQCPACAYYFNADDEEMAQQMLDEHWANIEVPRMDEIPEEVKRRLGRA